MFRLLSLLVIIVFLTISQEVLPVEITKRWVESVDCIIDGKLKNFPDPKKWGVQLPPETVKEEIVLNLEGKYPDMVTFFMDIKAGQVESRLEPVKAEYKLVLVDGKLSIRFAKSTLKPANVYWINIVIRYKDQAYEVEKFQLLISNPV